MLGAWSYASAAIGPHPPSLNTGLHVTITIEAVNGTRFSGHVTRWLAGDVGIPQHDFAPVTGSVDGSGGVTILVAWASPHMPNMPTITITGVLDGDVLTVRESWLGAGPGPVEAGDIIAVVGTNA